MPDIYAVEGTGPVGDWRHRQNDDDDEFLRYMLVPCNPFGGLIPAPVLPFEPGFGDAVRQAIDVTVRYFTERDVPPQQFPPVFGLMTGYSAVH